MLDIHWATANDTENLQALKDGKAVQGYCSFVSSRDWAARLGHPCDVWYTERNGDAITMLVPKGTASDDLPSQALLYIAFEWIPPEADFGGPDSVYPQRQ